MVKFETLNYHIKFVEFLATNNTIRINDGIEFNKFKAMCENVGLNVRRSWSEWVELAKRNENTGKFQGYICFEYDNNKGLSFYNDEKKSIDWYLRYPFTIEDFDDAEVLR